MHLAAVLLAAFVGFGVFGFFVSYIIVNIAFFHKFFGRISDEKLEKASLKSDYYDDFRSAIVEKRLKMEQLPNERVYIDAFDGIKLSARYYDRGYSRAVVFFHGARSIPWNSFGIIGDRFLSLGYNVLLVDMRAQGKSEGRYMSYGNLESRDVLSWIKWFDNKPIDRLLLYGSSMGSSAIAYASDKISSDKVKGLVLDCGYSSAKDLQRFILRNCNVPYGIVYGGYLLGKYLAKAEMSEKAAEHLKRNKIPTLFIHGTDDTVVPVCQGKENFDACGGYKEFIKVNGAGHTVALYKGGEAVKQKVCDFADAALSGNLV